MSRADIKHGHQSHLTMLFDGSSLFLRNIKSLRGNTEIFRAGSGNASSEPIPDGKYWIQTNEIHRIKASDDWTPRGFSKPTLLFNEVANGRLYGALGTALIKHTSAWGEYRIPIRQSVTQENITQRSKMFIHGGDALGSAGCIDLAHGINIFVAFLQKEHVAGSSYWIDLAVHQGH
jgi:hypothetical protein